MSWAALRLFLAGVLGGGGGDREREGGNCNYYIAIYRLYNM